MADMNVGALVSYIATRDRRIAKDQPWNTTTLRDYFTQLLDKGCVRVGGRATCGAGAVDPSWKVFCAWREVVSKARKLGLPIEAEDIKHGNAWATKARGFWDETEYSTPINHALRDVIAGELPRIPRQLAATVKESLMVRAEAVKPEE